MFARTSPSGFFILINETKIALPCVFHELGQMDLSRENGFEASVESWVAEDVTFFNKRLRQNGATGQ